MNDDLKIFNFEKDFAGSLRCIPMAVRFKLDQCRIKLSLRQWSCFTHRDRSLLVKWPCRAPAEIEIYRSALVELIAVRANELAKGIVLEPSPACGDVTHVPAQLCGYARSLGLEPPALDLWAVLTSFQRFALLKLTCDSHDNVNFVPAMREFDLLYALADSA
jgi:hypothetical protein